MSPVSEKAFTKNSTSARGNGAECEPWLDSAFDLDHVARPRDAGEATIVIVGSGFSGRSAACASTQQPATGGGLWIVRRVVEAVFGDVPDRLRAKLDPRLRCREVEHWLPGIFESVAPAARYSVVRFPPAQLVDEPPAPLPHVREHKIFHI